MKICILCGGVGHDQSECPWVEAQQERSVAPLFAISAVVALTCIASAVGLAVWLHGVNLSWAQAAWLVLEVFLAVSGSTAAPGFGLEQGGSRLFLASVGGSNNWESLA